MIFMYLLLTLIIVVIKVRMDFPILIYPFMLLLGMVVHLHHMDNLPVYKEKKAIKVIRDKRVRKVLLDLKVIKAKTVKRVKRV